MGHQRFAVADRGQDRIDSPPIKNDPMAGHPPTPERHAGSTRVSSPWRCMCKTDTEEDRWFHNRYLNEKMQPMNFKTPAPFAEFKQVFVRMKVLMDQRKDAGVDCGLCQCEFADRGSPGLMSLDDKTGTGKRRGAGGKAYQRRQDKIPPGPL